MSRPIRWACVALALALAVMGDFLPGPPGPGGARPGLFGAGSARAAELQVEAPRFTFDQAEDFFPIWPSDSGRITFSSLRQGNPDVYQKSLSGAVSGWALTQYRLTGVISCSSMRRIHISIVACSAGVVPKSGGAG